MDSVARMQFHAGTRRFRPPKGNALVVRAIDPWVNVNMGGQIPPKWLVRVKEDYFKAGSDFFKDLDVDELLEVMDRSGVEKAILTTDCSQPSDHVLSFTAAHPNRFALAAAVDPRTLMKGCWALRELVKDHPVVMARVIPFQCDLPPNHRSYYPLYASCIDLDLPISINTGIPGPPMPGECQHPMHLDRVCLDFPDLKICMAHGADPWWGVAIRLMIKYRNLHLMTSAYSPRYLPAELIHFMNTRGQDKILYASDHPVLSIERCVAEAQDLDLREGVLDKFLYQNADRLFFSPRKPRI
jgi:predicted TIM-barrel fold metal-dependent hydrolase